LLTFLGYYDKTQILTELQNQTAMYCADYKQIDKTDIIKLVFHNIKTIVKIIYLIIVFSVQQVYLGVPLS